MSFDLIYIYIYNLWLNTLYLILFIHLYFILLLPSKYADLLWSSCFLFLFLLGEKQQKRTINSVRPSESLTELTKSLRRGSENFEDPSTTRRGSERRTRRCATRWIVPSAVRPHGAAAAGTSRPFTGGFPRDSTASAALGPVSRQQRTAHPLPPPRRLLPHPFALFSRI